jgi:hypothetical protein
MSDFRQTWKFVKKTRHEQFEDLRRWSEELNAVSCLQTKPSSVLSAPCFLDDHGPNDCLEQMRDKCEAAVDEENNEEEEATDKSVEEEKTTDNSLDEDESKEMVTEIDDVEEFDETEDESKEMDSKSDYLNELVDESKEPQQSVNRQNEIVHLEQQLLHMWQSGPALSTARVNENVSYFPDDHVPSFQKENNDAKKVEAVDEENNSVDILVTQQEERIAGLEEQLTTTQVDIQYLESLLHLRDFDHARYMDLERKQRRRADFLGEKVDKLEQLVEDLRLQLEEKDKTLKLMDVKLDTLKKADQVSKELSMSQKMLTNSILALVSKQKKTKLVTAHSVRYITTKPREGVKDEMAIAEKRERDRKHTEQKAELAALVATVDRIAACYDRYTNVSAIITFSEPRSDVHPDHLFTWMEKELVGLWMYVVEPTPKEEMQYNKFLEMQLRPEPIYSPTLPTARVNWHRLNPSMKRNLPVPVQYPLHGCALDPEFYTTMGPQRYYLGKKMDPDLLFESDHPFAKLYGFWTSKGVLAPPVEPVGGYHCCPETGTWIIAAEGG